MSALEVCYLAHPLGGDVAANAARARRWLRWLMDREPDVAFCCPWLPFVDVGLPEHMNGPGAVDPDSLPEYRARCLRDDVAIARLCDSIVLCGPVISPGMRLELEAVVDGLGEVADLTDLVFSDTAGEPPAEWTIGMSPLALGRHQWEARL